jgi:hypothetical protein
MYKLDEEKIADYNELASKEQLNMESEQAKLEPKSKRVRSPYVLFCEEKRPELRASWPNASFGEMGAMLRQMWSQLDDASKEKYIDLACNERLKMIPEPKSDPYHIFSKPYYKFCNEKSNKVNQMFPDANIIEKGKIYQLLWSQLDESDKEKYVDLDCNERLKTISEPQPKPKSKSAPSPYILFCKEKKPEITKMFPNVTLDETCKMLPLLWSQLDEAGKAKYVR